MKLKQLISAICISGTIFTLAACSSAHRNDQSAVNDANAAYGAQASGLGSQTSGFGDQLGGGGRQQLSGRVYYFDFDSPLVHYSDKPAIAANANYLLAHPGVRVMLEGHTDPRGSREYNIGLGERRAKAVEAILTAKGVNPAQIRVVSYGAEKLASPGHAETDYQQDRRVVLVYLK